MAHFAEIDDAGKVVRVIVVSNNVLSTTNQNPGLDYEPAGIEFLNGLFGYAGNWRMTSYSNSFRKQYAGVDYAYDSENDVFIDPKPYPSWMLDANFDWQPPTPEPSFPPEDGGLWVWDEATLSWVSTKQI